MADLTARIEHRAHLRGELGVGGWVARQVVEDGGDSRSRSRAAFLKDVTLILAVSNEPVTRLACVDEHARLAPDLALPDALLLRLIDALVARDEREEILLCVYGQGHSVGDHTRQDPAELPHTLPHQPLDDRINALRLWPVHEQVHSWVDGGIPLGNDSERLLRLRLPRATECEESNDVHGEPLAPRGHFDDLVLLAGVQKLFEEDFNLRYDGRLEFAHRALRDGLPNGLATPAVVYPIEGCEDTRRVSEVCICIDPGFCDSRVEIYV